MKPLPTQLATKALHAANHLRQVLGLSLHVPLCIYDACEKLGVQVRFAEINSMEGMYYQGSPPKILLGARRPLPRRNFTCGHELGHHIFGHGSTIDHLQEEVSHVSWQPDEFLVDFFAASLLMPHVGLMRAFSVRSITPVTAMPEEIFAISCQFGIGYETLVNHLAHGVKLISRERAKELRRSSPKEIRNSLLQEDTQSPLIVVDEHWSAPTVDLEIDAYLLTPRAFSVEGPTLRHCNTGCSTELFRAVSPGIGRLINHRTGQSRFVRVSSYQFIGLSKYRHLEREAEQ